MDVCDEKVIVKDGFLFNCTMIKAKNGQRNCVSAFHPGTGVPLRGKLVNTE